MSLLLIQLSFSTINCNTYVHSLGSMGHTMSWGILTLPTAMKASTSLRVMKTVHFLREMSTVKIQKNYTMGSGTIEQKKEETNRQFLISNS